MKLYFLKKEKGKIYESEAICKECFGFQLFHEENGKPAAEISISHTQNYWVCMLDIGGVDIEEASRKVNPKIASRLHPLEQQYLSGLQQSSKEWQQEFLAIWTAKESYLKAMGTGLSGGLANFSVIAPDLSYAEKVGCFSIVHFNYSGCIGSIACLGPQGVEIESLPYAGRNKKDAFDFAADKLAEKAFSSKGLYQKMLSKGYGEKESAQVISRLTELGYINDELYAKDLVARAKQAGKGSLYIKNQFTKEGLDLSLYSEEDSSEEYSRALAYAESVFIPGSSREEKEKSLAKIGRKLASLGYTPNIVYKVLSKLR